jgi:hypothetical protein
MRTEEDLREAFDHLASTAPHPADLRAALRPRPHRSRRTAAIIGTAVATATAAVAAVVVPHVVSSGAPVADEDKQPSAWSNWVGLQTSKMMYEVEQIQTANRQTYQFMGGNGPWASLCNLQLHRNGDFDPATIPAGSQAIEVGNRNGQIVTWKKGHNPFAPTPKGPPVADITPAIAKTLVWQPVNGIWALLSCSSQEHLGTPAVPKVDAPYLADVKMIMTIARTVSPDPKVLRSPFKVGDGLAGLTPRHISYRPAQPRVEGAGDDIAVTWNDGDPGTGYQPQKLGKNGKPTPLAQSTLGNPATSPQVGDDLQISYTTSKAWDRLSRIETLKPDATIHGMKAYFTNDQSMLRTGDTKAEADALTQAKNVLRLEGNGVAVEIKSLGNQLTHDRLREIAESMKLTSHPKDPASWFDAATAIS